MDYVKQVVDKIVDKCIDVAPHMSHNEGVQGDTQMAVKTIIRNGETLTIETCCKCGMIANLDPSFHHTRYGHLPQVYRDGVLHQFSYKTYSFRPLRKG